MFSPTLFRLGIVYERITSLNLLKWLRGTLLCVFEKTYRATSSVDQKQEKAAGLVMNP